MPSAFHHIHDTHAAYKLNVYLEVNGKSVPVVEANVDFVLNQIPIARVVVPSGATFNSQGEAVDAQILTPDDLRGRVSAQLRVRGKGKPHPTNSTATPGMGLYDDFLFDGYVLSSTAAFSTTGVATTVVLVHWMYDLDLASFACGDFDKNAPDAWFTVENDRLATSDHSTPVWGAAGQQGIVADIEYLSADWWEDIIKPAAKYKASLPLRKFQTSNTPSNNQAAIAAMDRLVSKGCMKLNDAARQALTPCYSVQHAINETVGAVLFTGTGGSTAFEKFTSLLSTFGAVLAPRVDECLVMPYNPISKIDVSITDAECDFAGSSPNPALLPVGAIMYGGGSTGSLVNLDQSIVENTWTGQYVTTSSIDGGPFLVFPTPEYMNGIRRSMVPNGQFKSKVGIVPVTSPSQKPANAEQEPPATQFANEVAKSQYFSKVFSSKTQDVLCGFRLDIAPGDCLKVYKAADSASGRNVSGLAKEWAKRGIVESVTYTFSAPANRINTTYRLRHMMERQDMDLFGISDAGQPAALFIDKPSNAESPLKKV